jgi:HAD superfamily hydrolase (TIGR01509 family)
MKLVIFDLDGVLVDSRHLHYISLNDVLDEQYKISIDEHLSRYDGCSTRTKLEMLTREKRFPESLYDSTWKMKQQRTLDLIPQYIKPDEELIKIIQTLKNQGLQIWCASNSIMDSIHAMLSALGVLQLFDGILSNQDVECPKPSPEIYIKCFILAKVSPLETLIVEDSPIGKKAAYMSGAHVLPVGSRSDITIDNISKSLLKSTHLNKVKYVQMDLRWKKKINIVIPMAGNGSRFATEGYLLPKPLIDVQGEPMIQRVVKNLNIDGNYIFIVKKEHIDKYDLYTVLNSVAPGCRIIPTDRVTEGAVCSVLLAEKFIDNETNLLIANSDQFLEWDSNSFLYESQNTDGCVSTFHQPDPNDKKWSYARLGSNGFVEEIAEKNPISSHANTGIYFWSKGSDFVKYGNRLISKNIRTNGEFYIAPVYNEAIMDGKKIKINNCKKMWGLGVPDDLMHFLKNYII